MAGGHGGAGAGGAAAALLQGERRTRGSATTCRRRCYKPRARCYDLPPAMLQAQGGGATIGRWRSPAMLLQAAVDVAAIGRQRCCQRPASLLQATMLASSPATAVLP
jgi:hypothetical protein